MGRTITVRLTEELAEWLENASSRTSLPQGKIIRDALEKGRAEAVTRPYLRFAGIKRGARDLSQRKGFSKG